MRQVPVLHLGLGVAKVVWQGKQPTGTISQQVFYFDGPNEVARLHQYLRPDGTFGGSGLPEPKRIYENGVAYRQRQPAENRKEKIMYWLSDTFDRLCWALHIEVE